MMVALCGYRCMAVLVVMRYLLISYPTASLNVMRTRKNPANCMGVMFLFLQDSVHGNIHPLECLLKLL